MKEINLKIIDDVKIFLFNVQEKDSFRKLFCKSNAFIRKRVLTLSYVVLFLINMPKRTLSIELTDYFTIHTNGIKCTKSAFSQQRNKLNYSFFYAWNRILTDSFYKHNQDQHSTKGHFYFS